jgi:hypothetical protein
MFDNMSFGSFGCLAGSHRCQLGLHNIAISKRRILRALPAPRNSPLVSTYASMSATYKICSHMHQFLRFTIFDCLVIRTCGLSTRLHASMLCTKWQTQLCRDALYETRRIRVYHELIMKRVIRCIHFRRLFTVVEASTQYERYSPRLAPGRCPGRRSR